MAKKRVGQGLDNVLAATAQPVKEVPAKTRRGYKGTMFILGDRHLTFLSRYAAAVEERYGELGVKLNRSEVIRVLLEMLEEAELDLGELTTGLRLKAILRTQWLGKFDGAAGFKRFLAQDA